MIYNIGMQRVAIFPGSFDPFTRGHQMVVEEALKLFDRVVIAIGYNSAKRGFLTPESRKALIDRVYANDDRVETTIYSTLTGDEARRVGAMTMIRSVRNMQDFDYERTIDQVNRELFPELNTVLVLVPRSVEHISSSLVRELYTFGHDTQWLLPEGVVLENYLNEEIINTK